MIPRLLVVEDDDLQQNILKSALVKRGYEVDVASDGLAALRMMRAGTYDLALIDYQLPEIDGFTTARLLRDLMTEEDRPKLIAVTVSVDNLSGRNIADGAFDAIIQKSPDLPALLAAVDTHLRGSSVEQTKRAAAATWRELGLNDAPSVVLLPAPTVAQSNLLRCYFDLSGRRPPEAVLLLGPEAADAATTARTNLPLFMLPFIDLTGLLLGADARFSALDRASWVSVATIIAQFAARRQLMSPTVWEAFDLDTRLLSYVFLSAGSFAPRSDSASRDCVRYPGFFPDGAGRLAAERLATRGLLERRFFERFHLCHSCSSARLNVREECPVCHSAQLRDMPLIHHFRCSHQAGEDDFIRGPNLVCPKCRQGLRHYGSDYDKPGTASCCGACGTTSPEPAIGFTCLDCGSRTAGDAAAKRDVFSYVLTDAGTALLRRGVARAIAAASTAPPRLPDTIMVELTRPGPVLALLELRYGAAERIIIRRGESGLAAMRRLFVQNLLNIIQGECVVASAPDADYILVRRASPEILADLSPALLDACQEVLVEGLEPELRRLETADLAATLH